MIKCQIQCQSEVFHNCWSIKCCYNLIYYISFIKRELTLALLHLCIIFHLPFTQVFLHVIHEMRHDIHGKLHAIHESMICYDFHVFNELTTSCQSWRLLQNYLMKCMKKLVLRYDFHVFTCSWVFCVSCGSRFT